MRLIIISSSPFVENNHLYFAYSPYVKELEIWAKYSDEIAFFCPVRTEDNGLLISKINFPISKLFFAKEFNVKSPYNFFKAFLYSFFNFYKIFQSMIWADHIHLRCPGNIGLMGAIVQVFFPKKKKTAKYAGNWDPKSKQPLSYRLQKWILSNTFLTKNIQVLVYGEWERSSKNIKPFFTASYWEKDKLPIVIRNLENVISFIFVGTLSKGKKPLYAVKLVEKLSHLGYIVNLSFFGNGEEAESIQKYIFKKKLEKFIHLKGNHSQESIKKVYQESHFLILPSQSEGWPKVVAESMFWGCVPITTRVSCLENILDNGNRGLLLKMTTNDDVEQIIGIINNQEAYNSKAEKSIIWSRKYTLDLFETEIKILLNP